MNIADYIYSLLLSTGLPILCAWAVPYRVIDTNQTYLVVFLRFMFTLELLTLSI